MGHVEYRRDPECTTSDDSREGLLSWSRPLNKHWDRWKEVVLLCPQVLELDPKNPTVIHLFARGLGILGRFADVVTFADRFPAEELVSLHLLGALAKARLELGDPNEAIRLADEALANNPLDPEAQLVRVQSLARLGDWESVRTSGVAAYKTQRPRSRESVELLQILRTAHQAQQQ